MRSPPADARTLGWADPLNIIQAELLQRLRKGDAIPQQDDEDDSEWTTLKVSTALVIRPATRCRTGC